MPDPDFLGETHKGGGFAVQFRRENGVDRVMIRDDDFSNFLLVPASLIEKIRDDEWLADTLSRGGRYAENDNTRLASVSL